MDSPPHFSSVDEESLKLLISITEVFTYELPVISSCFLAYDNLLSSRLRVDNKLLGVFKVASSN